MFTMHSDEINSLLKKESKTMEIEITNEIEMRLHFSEYTKSLNVTVVRTIFDKVYTDSDLINENFSFQVINFNYKNLMSILKSKLIDLQEKLIALNDGKDKILIQFLDLYYRELMFSVNSGISINKYNNFSIISLWDLETEEVYNFRFFNNHSGNYYKFNVKPNNVIKICKEKELHQLLENLNEFNIYGNDNKYIEFDSTDYEQLVYELKRNILDEL